LTHLFFFFFFNPKILQINKLRGNSTCNINFDNPFIIMNLKKNENKQNKINLEDNIDLTDEYNNENMLDSNSENEKKINEDYINENQKLA